MERIYLHNSYSIQNYSFDGDLFKIDGYAAHFGEANLNNERCNAKTFEMSIEQHGLGRQNIVVNYNHDSDKIIGGVEKLATDNVGLFANAHLNTKIPFVRDFVVPNIEAGDIRAFSTEGFASYNDIVEYEDGTYMLKNLYLYAIAITNCPADTYSEFSIANCFRNLRDANRQDVENQVKRKYYLYC